MVSYKCLFETVKVENSTRSNTSSFESTKKQLSIPFCGLWFRWADGTCAL